MADRVEGSSGLRQQELDFLLPPGAAERKQRIRAIRHHFLCLIEDLPTRNARMSPHAMRSVKAFLKRLLKSQCTSWDGTGVFRQQWLAREWIVPARTLRNWMEKARREGWIETAVSTDERAVPRTTIQFCWAAIAGIVGRSALPKQTAMGAEQTAMGAEQTAMGAKQTAMVAALSGIGKAVAPASARAHRSGWAAAAAEIATVSPELSLTCLQSARAAGCTPAEVVRLATYWAAARGAWGPGALYRRIQRSHPGLAADVDWPPRRGVAQSRRVRSRADRVQQIREEVLELYRASPGLTMDEVGDEREGLVAAALQRAGIVAE